MAYDGTRRNRASRGGGRRGRGALFVSKWRRPQTYRDDSLVPEGVLIDVIRSDSLRPSFTGASRTHHMADAPRVTDEDYVGSYNWLDEAEATILVPGLPPRWSPPEDMPTLSEDDGNYFRDNNGARWPQYPSEPLVRALKITSPRLETKAIDVVGCGSTLGNLLRFARGVKWSFHFKAELVGETLFLVRQEKSPSAMIEGVYGYGHAYPEACTFWDRDAKGSATHQRMVTYRLGGLKILVRSETDGYLPEKLLRPEALIPELQTIDEPEGLDGLLASFGSARVMAATPVRSKTLKIRNVGTKPIPQEAIFDLKTRTARKAFDFKDVLPRRWLNRTPNFVLAQHINGKFQEPEIMDICSKVADWEKQNEEAITRFIAIINLLRGKLRVIDGARVGVWRIGDGDLQIHSIADVSWSALPPVIKRGWKGLELEET